MLISLIEAVEPIRKPLLSMTYNQCDARPMVNFPARAGTHFAYRQRDSQVELTSVAGYIQR